MVAISDINQDYRIEVGFNTKCIILKQMIKDLVLLGTHTRAKRRAIAKLERKLFELRIEKEVVTEKSYKRTYKRTW